MQSARSSRSLIETINNRFSDRQYEVELADPELTSICPLTGAPDFGTITIRYVPGEKLLELKALRDYLAGFRSREIFQEEVVNDVLDEIAASPATIRVEVEGVFNMRGGMTTRVVATSPGCPLGGCRKLAVLLISPLSGNPYVSRSGIQNERFRHRVAGGERRLVGHRGGLGGAPPSRA